MNNAKRCFRIFLALVTTGALVATSHAVYAKSNADFPTGWEEWPVVATGTISGVEAALPVDMPPILKDTFKTYNWIQDGKGSFYNVRINPAQKEAYASGKGQFDDGLTGVLELVDIKVLFVTEHLLGEPQYGAYAFDGTDLMGSGHASLEHKTCVSCHSGYTQFFKNGVTRR